MIPSSAIGCSSRRPRNSVKSCSSFWRVDTPQPLRLPRSGRLPHRDVSRFQNVDVRDGQIKTPPASVHRSGLVRLRSRSVRHRVGATESRVIASVSASARARLVKYGVSRQAATENRRSSVSPDFLARRGVHVDAGAAALIWLAAQMHQFGELFRAAPAASRAEAPAGPSWHRERPLPDGSCGLHHFGLLRVAGPDGEIRISNLTLVPRRRFSLSTSAGFRSS